MAQSLHDRRAQTRKTGRSVTDADEPIAKPSRADLFGHPAGLTILFTTEMWERFSYYGMRSLLVLYMIHDLLQPERSRTVIGLDALRRALESIAGPLGAQPFASQIYGLYTGFVYLTPILGGYLADRWLGRRRTVAIGAALMVAGHFLMAVDRLFLVALLLLILGNGAFKPNISTQVGGLYGATDTRVDRAYSIFYVGINVGAFFSPLVCGTLGEELGFAYGFGAAGVGMAIGLATYLVGLPRLPPDPPRAAREALAREPIPRGIWIGVLLLFLPSALFWAAYEQQGNTITLWAERFTDRSIRLFGWSGEIPITWFQAFNPLMIFVFTPPLVAWWGRLARRGREPATIAKLSLGCLGAAIAYAVMALAAFGLGDGKASWLWLLAFFAILTFAELYFSPIGLSLIARVAPQRARSTLMGVWLSMSFIGNVLAGSLGGLWSSLSPFQFFLVIAAAPLVGWALIELARRPLRGLLPGEP